MSSICTSHHIVSLVLDDYTVFREVGDWYANIHHKQEVICSSVL